MASQDLFAQNRDIIKRSDTGKKMTVDKVIGETYKEIRYKLRSSEKTITTDKVEEIIYYDVPTAFKNGLAFVEKGEYENALNSFQLAMEARGVRDWIQVYSLFEKAKAYQQWGLSDNSKFKNAVETFNELLDQAPETRFYAEVLFGLAMSYSLSGDLANAVKAFDQLAQEAYEKKLGVIWEARAKYEKALAQMNGGKYDDAERDLRSAMTFATEQAKTVKDDPGLQATLNRIAGLARLNQGTVLIKKKKNSDARRFFEEILNNTSSSRDAQAGAMCGLGECLLSEKKLKEAQEQFATAKVLYFDLAEEGARATYFLGELCLELKDKEPNYKKRAKDYFQEVIDLYPETSWAKQARAKIE
ncbi:MAG: tetratricopeptide repeat protein [Planctomycetota bacterium]